MKRPPFIMLLVVAACREDPPAIDTTQRSMDRPVPSSGTAGTPKGVQRDILDFPKRAKQDARKLGVSVGRFGPYVVDANGRSLYAFSIDDAGQTACLTNCATVWPPAIVETIPRDVGAGIDASRLTLTRRPDGTTQLALEGHPLYFSESDLKTGDTWGHYAMSFGGRFMLLSPAGRPLPPPK